MIITLDGPTASGKSSIARALAHKVGGMHFNSGFIYRTIGHIAAQRGYDKESIQMIQSNFVQEIIDGITYQYAGEAQIVFKDNNVTHLLKAAHIDALASCVSELPSVRDLVNEYARKLTFNQILVADGRDCGTVMFLQADYKFFITASVEARAQRWLQDQKKQGKEYSFKKALALINERDYRDTHRAIAPLAKAVDAVVIDTTGKTLGEVVGDLLSSMI